MSKTVRKASVLKKIKKNSKDLRKRGGMTVDEYLLQLRVQNLNSGVSDY